MVLLLFQFLGLLNGCAFYNSENKNRGAVIGGVVGVLGGGILINAAPLSVVVGGVAGAVLGAAVTGAGTQEEAADTPEIDFDAIPYRPGRDMKPMIQVGPGRSAPSAVSTGTAVKPTDLKAIGKVNGIGTAAVVVETESDKGGDYELALITQGRDGWANVDSVPIGDRAQVSSVELRGNEIIVTMTTYAAVAKAAGNDFSMRDVVRRYAVVGDRLVMVGEETVGNREINFDSVAFISGQTAPLSAYKADNGGLEIHAASAVPVTRPTDKRAVGRVSGVEAGAVVLETDLGGRTSYELALVTQRKGGSGWTNADSVQISDGARVHSVGIESDAIVVGIESQGPSDRQAAPTTEMIKRFGVLDNRLIDLAVEKSGKAETGKNVRPPKGSAISAPASNNIRGPGGKVAIDAANIRGQEKMKETVGPVWRWVSTMHVKGPMSIPPESGIFTIQLWENGIVDIQADCVFGKGDYSVDEFRIGISVRRTTKSLCQGETLREQFLRWLGKAEVMLRKDDFLYLNLSNADTMKFQLMTDLRTESDRASEARKWANRAGIEYSAGNFGEVLRCLSTAIKLKPDFLEATVRRASIYAAMGEYEKSMADYSTAMQLSPGDPHALLGLSELKIMKGDYEGALKTVETVMTGRPSDRVIALFTGCIARRMLSMDIALCEESIRRAIDGGTRPVWPLTGIETWLEYSGIEADKKEFIEGLISLMKNRAD